MQKSRVWREFEALSPTAQREVADFIAFLNARARQNNVETRKAKPLRDEPFIGLWRDRKDLSESSAWVRRLRSEEWKDR